MQFSAKTKNEAITKACIELGVSSDQLDIQVVSEGSSGFFGIGSKPAIIKARKKEDLSEEKEIEEIVDSVKIDAFKAEEKKETPVQAAPAPAVSAPQAAGTDDGELAAVIAAAIAASEGTSTDGFVVRSIKRRKSNKWN